MFYIAGLGNPGEKYELTRHNTGRLVIDAFRKSAGFEDWSENKKIKSLVSESKLGKEKIMLILPETFMNKSGNALKPLIISKQKAKNLIVVHDDIDMPLGKFKISFGRGSGGHKGIESIMRAIKTKEFIRIKVGVSPAKKPKGEKKILDFIIGKFSPKETEIFKKTAKKIISAVEAIIESGYARAMNEYN